MSGMQIHSVSLCPHTNKSLLTHGEDEMQNALLQKPHSNRRPFVVHHSSISIYLYLLSIQVDA